MPTITQSMAHFPQIPTAGFRFNGSNPLMLKFPPWVAEMEKMAFKEGDDGWMSGNASRVPLPLPSR